MNFFYVALGGGGGALTRYIVSRAVDRLVNGAAGGVFFIPLGTLAVNCAGALCAGLVFGFFEGNSGAERIRLLILTGFLGGFTTFSTFSIESARLFLSGAMSAALINVILNNTLCLIAVFAGMSVYKYILKN